jgi:DNA polymerase-3 subunit alpha
MLQEQGHRLTDDAIITLKARVDRRDETRLGLMAQDITVLDELEATASGPLRLRVPASALNELKIHQIKKVLRDHPGDSPVFLHIGQGKVLRLADEFRVDLDRAVADMKVLLGHDAVVV